MNAIIFVPPPSERSLEMFFAQIPEGKSITLREGRLNASPTFHCDVYDISLKNKKISDRGVFFVCVAVNYIRDGNSRRNKHELIFSD